MARIPEWMDARTVAAMRAAERQARARGRDGAGEAWDVARGHHPALPSTMILDAVAAVLAPQPGEQVASALADSGRMPAC